MNGDSGRLEIANLADLLRLHLALRGTIQIEKRLVRYEREDGVPLSFELLLPPGYEEGTPMPTVLYAYPLEYSGAATAGQEAKCRISANPKKKSPVSRVRSRNSSTV